MVERRKFPRLGHVERRAGNHFVVKDPKGFNSPTSTSGKVPACTIRTSPMRRHS